jgi:hypothetical protein
MKTFTEFLQEKHADGYMGTDDNMPDAFEAWLEDIQLDGVIEYGDEYRAEQVQKIKDEVANMKGVYSANDVMEKVKTL